MSAPSSPRPPDAAYETPIAAADDAAPAPPPAGLRAVMVAAGNALFHWRNALFPVAFVAIAAVSKPLAPFGSERADLVLDAIGLAVALAGQTLRAAVIGLAYIRRGGKDRRIYAETLVQEGFFAHSRNPLYLGNMLVFLGLFLILGSRAGYLVGIPFFFLAYLAITLAEEDFLGRRFGAEYADYLRRVNRYIPSLGGLGATMRSMTFDWKRLLRKEYGSTFIWMTAALALFAYEAIARLGPDAARPRVVAALVAWIPVVLGYLFARWLKKSRRLVSS